MVDGLNPQTGNMLREASGANSRTAQDTQNSQTSTNPAAQERNDGAARPVQDVSVEISAQGQQAGGEQVTGQAVSEPSAADTNPATTSASAAPGDNSATEQPPVSANTSQNAGPQDADEALGTRIDTRA